MKVPEHAFHEDDAFDTEVRTYFRKPPPPEPEVDDDALGFSIDWLQQTFDEMRHRTSPEHTSFERDEHWLRVYQDTDAPDRTLRLSLTTLPACTYGDVRVVLSVDVGRWGVDGVWEYVSPVTQVHLPVAVWDFVRMFTDVGGLLLMGRPGSVSLSDVMDALESVEDYSREVRALRVEERERQSALMKNTRERYF